MKEDQDQHQEATATGDSAKRKLEDSSFSIELAKQKAQEIAARLVSDAESKRPRLEEEPFQPSPVFNPPPYPVSFTAQSGQSYGSPGTSKKITIPNGKVGVIIGKGGETIKQLQLQSGAKIQITRDSEADLNSLTRDVDLTGTSEQISRAEQLISDVIAEADAGGSAPPSTNQGFNSIQPGTEQFVMKVPNNKVALIIGKGGETIRNMQSKSGARIQVVPLHLPPGDMSAERSVYINGVTEQIEAAKELVNEVISGKRLVNTSGTNSYMQQSYAPPGNWAPPGQAPIQQQQPHYGYTQPGSYAPPASYYGNYPPTQVAGWDQSNQVPSSQPPQESSAYNYYGQQPPMGSAPPNPSYNYNQTPPVASHGYDQGYAQQPPSYGQNISSQAPGSDQQQQYATSGYGPPAVPSSVDGSASSQSTQPSAAYPVPYSQPPANSQAAYWQPHTQTGYYQTSYGGQQAVEDPSAASQSAVYGQGGYPQPDPSHYGKAVNPPVNGESQHQPQHQSQPPTNGYADPSGYAAEKTGERNSEEDRSASAAETVGSES